MTGICLVIESTMLTMITLDTIQFAKRQLDCAETIKEKQMKMFKGIKNRQTNSNELNRQLERELLLKQLETLKSQRSNKPYSTISNINYLSQKGINNTGHRNIITFSCGVCQSPSEMHCKDCNFPICNECQDAFHSKGEFRDHMLLRVTEPQENRDVLCCLCYKRKGIIDCRDCDGPLCNQCLQTVHSKYIFNSHRLTPLGSISMTNINNTHDVQCGICNNELAVIECLDCKFSICVRCQTRHHSQGMYQNHKVVPFTKASINSNFANLCGLCEEFPSSVDCEDCQCSICLKCREGIHSKGVFKDHVILPLGSNAHNKKIAKEDNAAVCGMCTTRRSTIECLDCNFGICNHCQNTTHARGKFKFHKLARVGTIQAQQKTRIHPSLLCGICEEEEAIVDCLECGFGLCEQCKCSIHSKGLFLRHKTVIVGTLASYPHIQNQVGYTETKPVYNAYDKNSAQCSPGNNTRLYQSITPNDLSKVVKPPREGPILPWGEINGIGKLNGNRVNFTKSHKENSVHLLDEKTLHSEAGEQELLQNEIIELIKEHDPKKLDSIDETLTKFAGREKQLLKKLKRQISEADKSSVKHKKKHTKSNSTSRKEKSSNESSYSTHHISDKHSKYSEGNQLDTGKIKKEIYIIFKRYNPSKLSELKQIYKKYKGRESELLEKLQRKYEKGAKN